MDLLPFEIWQEIINFLNHSDFKSAIELRQVCRRAHKLEIYDFTPALKWITRLDKDHLKSYPFIKKINIRNSKITDISYLTKIESIIIGPKMTDSDLKYLNPLEFNVGNKQNNS